MPMKFMVGGVFAVGRPPQSDAIVIANDVCQIGSHKIAYIAIGLITMTLISSVFVNQVNFVELVRLRSVSTNVTFLEKRRPPTWNGIAVLERSETWGYRRDSAGLPLEGRGRQP